MAQYLPWLVAAARATGYPVVELRGWRGHNHGPMASHIYGVMCHHTAGPDPYPGARNDFPSINVVRNGRTGLPGPLAQLGLGWNGTIYLVSDGLAYHGGSGAWRGVSGNSRFIGIEAEDAGDGDWAPAQLDCYPRLVAALMDWLNQDAGWVCGHKEYAPRRKIDPAGIDMPRFRGTTTHYLRNPHLIKRGTPEDDMTPEEHAWLRAVHHEVTLFLPNRREPGRDKERDTTLGFAASAEGRAYRLEKQVAGLSAAVQTLAAAVESQGGLSADELTAVIRDAMDEVVQVEISVREGETPKA
jgi:hypothetical protein